jgi:hypothetical protein
MYPLSYGLPRHSGSGCRDAFTLRKFLQLESSGTFYCRESDTIRTSCSDTEEQQPLSVYVRRTRKVPAIEPVTSSKAIYMFTRVRYTLVGRSVEALVDSDPCVVTLHSTSTNYNAATILQTIQQDAVM